MTNKRFGKIDPPSDELVKVLEKDEWFANKNRGCFTTMELLELHKFLCQKGRDLMAKKNSDYSNPERSADPFRNFQAFGAFGILVRLSDKLARLRVFVEKASDGKTLAVKDEAWEDTLIDAINYLVILDGWVRTHNHLQGKTTI